MRTIENLLTWAALVTDKELFDRLRQHAISERAQLIENLVIIAELDERKSALPIGYPSLFVYCRSQLGYCERTAYRRIAAARLCRRYPLALALLEAGRIHLTGLVLMRQCLTQDNHRDLLERIQGASLEEIKRLGAQANPATTVPRETSRPIAIVKAGPAVGDDAGSLKLKLDAYQTDLGVEPKPILGVEITPLIEIRTEHRFTLSDAVEAKLARARELLSHVFPGGELESIIDAALDVFLDKMDPNRRPSRPGLRDSPSPQSQANRRIPEWVKRRVGQRDQGRCAFVSADGRRCGERRFLQFDHIMPWSMGGRSDDPENIRQLCSSHNRWRAQNLNHETVQLELDRSAAEP